MTYRAPPQWATLIRNEIDDTDTSQRLIDGLLRVAPILQQMVTHQSRTKYDRAPVAAVRRNFKKTLRQATHLQESLSAIERDQDSQFAIAQAQIWVDLEDKREFPYPDFLQSLLKQLEFTISILNEAICVLDRGPGQPATMIRDFVVRTVAVAFREEAPDVERSHASSSLFYKVTIQILDATEIYEQQLSRTIKRLSEKDRLP